MQPNFYRVGAGAAMLGAVVGLIFNLLHPRSSEAFDSPEAELQLIADSGIWRWDHIMLGFAVAIGFVGFVAISISMFDGPSANWARAAAIFGAMSGAVILVLLALDGVVAKGMAEEFVKGDEATRAAALLVVEINTALLGASIALFFGVTPLLFGEALLGDPGYANNLGMAEIGGGALGLLSALTFALSGLTALGIYLFLAASLLHTIVLFLAGWTLWQRGTVDVAVAAPATGAT